MWLIAVVMTRAFLYVYSSMSLLSSMLNERLVYHTRGLAFVHIQAVGVTNCRNKEMVKHTNNEKQHGNAENKTAFYYIRYRQASVSRSSVLSSSLKMVVAPKSPIGRVFQFFMPDDDNDRRTKPIAYSSARAYAARANRL